MVESEGAVVIPAVLVHQSSIGASDSGEVVERQRHAVLLAQVHPCSDIGRRGGTPRLAARGGKSWNASVYGKNMENMTYIGGEHRALQRQRPSELRQG